MLILKPFHRIIPIIVILLGCIPAFAQQPTQGSYDKRLQVAVKVFEPLVFKGEDGVFSGFSIDLWRQIARVHGFEYEYVEVETVVDQLNLVERRQADIAIAGISITSEREENVDFSYSYFDGGLQIMTRVNSGLVATDFLAALLSPALLEIFLFFGLMILVAAHLIWLTERNHNPDFPRGYLPGISEAIWWSAVTVTTVGYGDRTPRGCVGRMAGLVWMFAGLFLIANFTASVTSVITLQQLNSSIETVDDLRTHSVTTVTGSTAADYLMRQRIGYHGVESIDDAYELLHEGRVDAVVYDSPALLYYAETIGYGEVQVVGNVFNREKYGIALPVNSPYREIVNITILAMLEDGTYDALYARWFGETPD